MHANASDQFDFTNENPSNFNEEWIDTVYCLFMSLEPMTSISLRHFYFMKHSKNFCFWSISSSFVSSGCSSWDSSA